MCGFVSSPRIDAFQQRKYVYRFELCDRAFSDVRKDKRLEPLLLVQERLLVQGSFLYLEPFAGEQLERVSLSSTFCLTLNAGIRPHRHQPSSFQATLPGDLEGDLRVGSEREQLLATIKVVLEPPTSGPRGVYQEIKAVTVEQLDRPFACLGIANRGVRELLGGSSWKIGALGVALRS